MSHWRRSQRLETPRNFHSLFSKTRCLWSLICGSCCHNQADYGLIERSAWLRLLRVLGTEGLNPMVMLLFTTQTGRLGWKHFPDGYRIYSINRPGRLLNFWTLRVGAYSRWAIIQGWALIKFRPFSASEVCLFCNKTINANNQKRGSNKARFL